ncbi:MAG: hypothetical protein ITG02_09915 [Patulibacter sp.]|nr:hypothetical protein [Patulibacter sp.]
MHLPARHTQNPTVWIFDADSDRLIGRVPIIRTDLRTVDQVARTCCAAKQRGLRPSLRGSTPEFYALLDLAGLVGAVGAQVQTPPLPSDRA